MLFAAAIISIIASTYVLVMVIFVVGQQQLAEEGHGPGGSGGSSGSGSDQAIEAISWFQPEVLIGVILATILVVGLGSMFKVSQLSAGGHVIAEHLGGRRLSPDTSDLYERKILNVVEEMAIASGTPVPPVFYMDNEAGINAFAAGFSPEDAVIGITRGCVEQLSRDELQGVVAHEFSHILNGDMKLNIRLIGIVHGILIVGIIGYYVMRIAFSSGHRRSRDDNKGALAFAALGVGLMVIGFLGTLFGNMIKAAVSRQREFLADASAVQFTRNPEGIGGALKKIGGFKQGSAITSPNAPEASHMFFSMGITSGFNAMFATHPPIDERVSRIDRNWTYEKNDASAQASESSGAAAAMANLAGGAAAGFAGATATPSAPASPTQSAPRATGTPPPLPVESAIASIGQPTNAHVAYAHDLIAAIPDTLVSAAREPYGARALIYAMLLDEDDEVRQRQLDRLNEHADQGVFTETQRLYPAAESLSFKLRLPLIDLAIPALRALSPSQYAAFRDNMDVLVQADNKIDLFEWALQKIVLRHLEPHFTDARPPRASIHKLDAVSQAISVLISALSYVGASDSDAALEAFNIGIQRAELKGLKHQSVKSARLGALDDALNELAKLTPTAKRTLIHACGATVAADDKITTSEAELLRAVSDTLACPMPPLLPSP